jgi:hypothetical protein
VSEQPPVQRRTWTEGPDGGAGSEWLSLTDDELLFRVEALPPDHDSDEQLIEVVRSERHFFVRQEAAKRIRNLHLLREHSGDRHIGQILVRGMTRSEDRGYLEKLIAESRHLEVRKAAEAQLRLILSAKTT